ncbi:aryl hydrocarbon receptor nuclear translocator-like protein 1 isoform X2 [Thrips palmi]|uniref:Aryl hydrocarbon receptor nuclear translocator-like protein 1 isoform X2 n=1 Tax=Thrips palmi TaxID=161013 RepID=A0A6P9AG03_THRPL|nr:aryl hydrocarbon receptor nuclear translocator-like protein 1 isoform X2 [Thrips palmi]
MSHVGDAGHSQDDGGYSELLELEDDRDEYLPLEQLKPAHLQQLQQLQQLQPQHNVYYELTTTATNVEATSSVANESSCSAHTSMYLGGPRTGGGCGSGLDDDLDGLGPGPGPSLGALGQCGPHQAGMDHVMDHAMELPPQVDSTRNLSKKRKGSYHDGSDFDDDTEDGKSCRTDDKKQNHSEIEKRRRDKMNTYITELSAMVPMCHAMSRKLDKLTVLRMAVQHLKTIRGAVHSYTEGHYKPAFLSDQELKHLILQTAEGFLFVVGCDRGRILFVSESVSQVLNFSQGDLLGQSWFDILHPKDVAKVKEQLSASDLSPRERLIDAKTMLPVRTDMPAVGSRLCPGARRSFFCRMKRKLPTHVKEEADTTSCSRRKKPHSAERKYSVIQCTGYLKSWAPEKMGLEESELVEGEGGAGAGGACLSCLVAVGRLQPILSPPPRPRPGRRPPNTRPLQFTSRHAMDGKFLFVDQRATLALGFLPQELLGTSMYEYYHPEDVPHLAESHKAALNATDVVTTKVYWFRSKEGSYISIQSEWKAFKNPWTKDVEYLIAKNSVIMTDGRHMDMTASRHKLSGTSRFQAGYDLFSQPGVRDVNLQRDIQRIISSHVEASKIGRKIADDALDSQRLRGNGDSSSNSTPSPAHQECSPAESKQSPSMASDTGRPPGSGPGPGSGQDPLASPQHEAKDIKTLQSPLPLPASPASQVSPSLPAGSNGSTSGQDATTETAMRHDVRHDVRQHGVNIAHSASTVDPSAYSSIRNNVTLSSLATPDPGCVCVLGLSGLANEDDMLEMMGPVMPESPGQGASNDGNDEAAMAVIMSLLEADAGLGGPVDFSGLPWPLP